MALTSAQVAEALGRSLDWFYRNRPTLERGHGFPMPLPMPGHPRWDARAVEDWKRRDSGAAAQRNRDERELIERALG